MSLGTSVTQLGSVLEASSKGGGDSSAAQLELLHDVEQRLRLGPAGEIKAHQEALEKHLTAALLQGPSPPLRSLISSAYVYAYGRGARQNMYQTVGTMLSWMNNSKGSPASSVSAKAAVLALLGDLAQAHGGAMVALCHDIIALLVKSVRAAPEPPLRAAACYALAAAVHGSGGVPKDVQQEALKNLKHVLSERGAPAELRLAALACCPPLVAFSEGLWASDVVEQVAALCTKHLDDPAAAVRQGAAEALGESLVAALGHPFTAAAAGGADDAKAAKPKPKNQFGKMFGGGGGGGGSGGSGGSGGGGGGPAREASSAMEAAVGLLIAPFVAKTATRELRSGISRAFVAFARTIRRPERERHATYLLGQLQGLLGAPAGSRQLYECVSHAMRAGLGETLSERGQNAMAGALAEAAVGRAASDGVVLVSLKECSTLLLSLREVATRARDALLQGERPLLLLVEHPTKSVRLAACACLWALVVAFPSQLAGMLNATTNRMRTEHAKLASSGAAPAADPSGIDKLLAHAHTVGALVCAVPHTPYGAPQALTTATLDAASDLASTQAEPAQRAAWVLLRALMRLDPEWLGSKQRLSNLYALWKGVLGGKVEGADGGGGRANAERVERELRCRAHCLECIVTFLMRVPEAYSAPLLKPIVGSLLPPNTALLASCREGAAALGKDASGFRPAFILFRCRLYQLLGALPSSTLSAKLLNVVMPLVVADIVDPTSTLAPTNPALAPLLDDADEPLGGSADDERPPEPMADGVSSLALASCDELAELKGHGAGMEHESQALSAAVTLFAAVFRLQTSDVRQQLLGHLCTAAAKAAEKAAKDAKGGGGGGAFGLGGGGGGAPERSPYSSPLANVSAALLGSLTKLRHKPSKSPLAPSLAGSIDDALAPCLADGDPAVRRAAAQAVGMATELLGPAFASRFVGAAQARLADAKTKDEAKAGYALALSRLARASHASAVAGAGAHEGPPVPLKQIVGMLAEAANDANASPMVCEWATHAIASVAAAAASAELPAEAFRPLAGACLGVASSLCLSEPRPNSHTARAIARLGTSMIAALGADEGVAQAAAAGGKASMQLATTIRRCGVLNAAACSLGLTPGLQAEALHYASALLTLPASLLPPSTPSVHGAVLPGAILEGLRSYHLPLRRAAVGCQRALCEVAAAAGGGGAGAAAEGAAGGVGRDQLVGALFDALDAEPSEAAMEEAKMLLLSQLHATAEAEPTLWLKALRDVVLEVKKAADAGGGGSGGGGGGGGGGGRGGDDDEGGGEEEEGGGGWDQNASGLPTGESTEDSEAARRQQKELEMEAEEAAKWAYVAPRWQTRLFAVECVRRLLAVLQRPEHFDLQLSRAAAGSAGAPAAGFLVEQLQEVVSVAFTAATSPFEAVRPAGIATVLDVADKFGAADDPEYEGHILLELFAAQISAAIRPCFAPDAEPSLTATACAATSRYLLAVASSERGHDVDPVAVRKLLGLLTKLASPTELASLAYPAYSESAATMVRVAALQAAAQLLQAAAEKPAAYAELAKQLAPHLPPLRDCWLALLRDMALLDTQPKSARRFYRPHLYAPATARAAHNHLLNAWPPVLAALVAMLPTPAWGAARDGATPVGHEPPPSPRDDGSIEPQELKTRPAAEDVALLLGIATHRLAAYVEAGGHVPDEERAEALLCISALKGVLAAAPPPPADLARIVALLRALAACPHATDDVQLAVSELTEAVCAVCAAAAPAGGGAAADPAAAALLAPLAALAAAPLLRACPHLGGSPSPRGTFGGGGGVAWASPVQVASGAPPPPPPAAEAVPQLLAGLKCIGSLPKAAAASGVGGGGASLPWLPSALLLSLHMAALGASASVAPLAAAATDAVRALLALLPAGCAAPAEAASTASLVARSAAETALALTSATPPARRQPMVDCLLACANALPPSAPASAPTIERVHAVLAALLSSGDVGQQRVAIGALTAELQRGAAAAAGGAPLPPHVAGHMRRLLPEVAPLLLRATPSHAADKPAALKLLLLACAVSPPDALAAVFSLSLPLIIGCLRLEVDGPPPSDARELSSLAHTAITALAKRSPDEFRTVAAAFSPETRTRMETALREAVAATRSPATAAGGAAAGAPGTPGAEKPKIALKMDFSSFGKK